MPNGMAFFKIRPFLVAKSALGPHGANPPNVDMRTGKISQFLKIRVFLESRVALGVDGPYKPAAQPKDTHPARCCRLPTRPVAVYGGLIGYKSYGQL